MNDRLLPKDIKSFQGFAAIDKLPPAADKGVNTIDELTAVVMYVANRLGQSQPIGSEISLQQIVDQLSDRFGLLTARLTREEVEVQRASILRAEGAIAMLANYVKQPSTSESEQQLSATENESLDPDAQRRFKKATILLDQIKYAKSTVPFNQIAYDHFIRILNTDPDIQQFLRENPSQRQDDFVAPIVAQENTAPAGELPTSSPVLATHEGRTQSTVETSITQPQKLEQQQDKNVAELIAQIEASVEKGDFKGIWENVRTAFEGEGILSGERANTSFRPIFDALLRHRFGLFLALPEKNTPDGERWNLRGRLDSLFSVRESTSTGTPMDGYDWMFYGILSSSHPFGRQLTLEDKAAILQDLASLSAQYGDASVGDAIHRSSQVNSLVGLQIEGLATALERARPLTTEILQDWAGRVQQLALREQAYSKVMSRSTEAMTEIDNMSENPRVREILLQARDQITELLGAWQKKREHIVPNQVEQMRLAAQFRQDAFNGGLELYLNNALDAMASTGIGVEHTLNLRQYMQAWVTGLPVTSESRHEVMQAVDKLRLVHWDMRGLQMGFSHSSTDGIFKDKGIFYAFELDKAAAEVGMKLLKHGSVLQKTYDDYLKEFETAETDIKGKIYVYDADKLGAEYWQKKLQELKKPEPQDHLFGEALNMHIAWLTQFSETTVLGKIGKKLADFAKTEASAALAEISRINDEVTKLSKARPRFSEPTDGEREKMGNANRLLESILKSKDPKTLQDLQSFGEAYRELVTLVGISEAQRRGKIGQVRETSSPTVSMKEVRPPYLKAKDVTPYTISEERGLVVTNGVNGAGKTASLTAESAALAMALTGLPPLGEVEIPKDRQGVPILSIGATTRPGVSRFHGGIAQITEIDNWNGPATVFLDEPLAGAGEEYRVPLTMAVILGELVQGRPVRITSHHAKQLYRMASVMGITKDLGSIGALAGDGKVRWQVVGTDHTLEEGIVDSLGVEMAGAAGIPTQIIENAKRLRDSSDQVTLETVPKGNAELKSWTYGDTLSKLGFFAYRPPNDPKDILGHFLRQQEELRRIQTYGFDPQQMIRTQMMEGMNQLIGDDWEAKTEQFWEYVEKYDVKDVSVCQQAFSAVSTIGLITQIGDVCNLPDDVKYRSESIRMGTGWEVATGVGSSETGQKLLDSQFDLATQIAEPLERWQRLMAICNREVDVRGIAARLSDAAARIRQEIADVPEDQKIRQFAKKWHAAITTQLSADVAQLTGLIKESVMKSYLAEMVKNPVNHAVRTKLSTNTSYTFNQLYNPGLAATGVVETPQSLAFNGQQVVELSGIHTSGKTALSEKLLVNMLFHKLAGIGFGEDIQLPHPKEIGGIYVSMNDAKSEEGQGNLGSEALTHAKFLNEWIRAGKPPVVAFFDEPYTGTNPENQASLVGSVSHALVEGGGTVILTTHDTQQVSDACGRANVPITHFGISFNENGIINRQPHPGTSGSETFVMAEKLGLDSELVTIARILAEADKELLSVQKN